MRVLSIDDSKTDREAIRNMTEVLDLEFAEAENGEAALNVLESFDGKVNLILLAWDMPVMDGHTFLKTIKRDPRYRSIPVIVVTTVTRKEKEIDAIRAGAKQYITKPFSSEDLLTKIVEALGIEKLEAGREC